MDDKSSLHLPYNDNDNFIDDVVMITMYCYTK